MQEYDIIFSLGFACGCSQALRAAGLQYASYPLDWIGSFSLEKSVDAVVSDFAHWLDEDALQLVDVLHGPGFGTRAYLNERTQIGFCHEFPDTMPFSESYPGVRATYDRRIERLLSRLNVSARILAVYVEHAFREGLSIGEMEFHLNRLRAKFPQGRVDMVYFHEDQTMGNPQAKCVSDGLTVVGADYRKMENGVPTQYLNVPLLAKWFGEHFSIPREARSSDQTQVAAEIKTIRSLRWGPDKSPFKRWINQRAYKTYRHLERILQHRGLIHSEKPLFFWGQT